MAIFLFQIIACCLSAIVTVEKARPKTKSRLNFQQNYNKRLLTKDTLQGSWFHNICFDTLASLLDFSSFNTKKSC